jgi:protein SCO1/2
MSERFQRRPRTFAPWCLLVTVFCTLLFAGCEPQVVRPQFKNLDITGIDYARDFALTDENGTPRTLLDFRGKVVLIFFGYTQCPDVCPTTMADFSTVMKRLGPDAKRVQVLFVTIDPERDTPDVLKRYVPNFDPNFLGLYGTKEQTAAVAKEFKVFYQKVDGPTAESYSMDHTAGTYVFDGLGHPRLYLPNAATPDDVTHDLKILLAPAAG